MEFSSPRNTELRQTAREVNWSVGAPRERVELSDEQLERLEARVHRVKETDGERGRVIEPIEPREGDEREVRNFQIDLSLLQKILYEHRRYALAQGFSDAEMDVLRAVEFHREKRVGVDEIMESHHATEYSESTVYKSLRTLQEKGLLSKVRPGVYRYDGP